MNRLINLILFVSVLNVVHKPASSDRQIFAGTMVSDARFASTFILKTIISSTSPVHAASMCSRRPTCTTFCRLANTSYMMTNIVSYRNNEDTMAGNLITCFTREARRTIYPEQRAALGITMFGYRDDYTSVPLRLAPNLMDGVYTRNIEECFMALTTIGAPYHPYLLVNFGSVQKLSGLSVMLQPQGIASNKFNNIEIRVGNVTAYQYMDSYKLVYSYLKAGLPINSVITITFPDPVWAQYMCIQHMTSYAMQFCTIEVF